MSVLIATPAYGGLVTLGYLNSVLRILDLCGSEGIQADLLTTGNEAAITRGRSNLATTFLKTGFDVMAFLDADIDINPDDFMKLLRLDKPIRGAACGLKTDDNSEKLNCFVDGKHISRAEMPDRPFIVSHLGAAVMLIKREVIETLSKIESLQYDDSQLGPGCHIFHERVVDRTLETEDFAFVTRAREHGFDTWVEPSVIVGHTGPNEWRF